MCIVDSSFVSRLQRDLEERQEVSNVPVPVTLIGKSGLGLQGLRSLIDQEATRPSPAYIVLCVGVINIVGLSSYA